MDSNNLKLSHNPTTVINSHLSMSRSLFLTSNIAFALHWQANKMENFGKKYYIISLFVIIFSIIYGYVGNNKFKKYLNLMEKLIKNNKKPNHQIHKLEIESAKVWLNFVNIYILFLICLLIWIFIKHNNL